MSVVTNDELTSEIGSHNEVTTPPDVDAARPAAIAGAGGGGPPDAPGASKWGDALRAAVRMPMFISTAPVLVTLVTLFFTLFPWLQRPPRPEVRQVEASCAAVFSLQQQDAADLGVFVEIVAHGYDAKDLMVATQWFDGESGPPITQIDDHYRHLKKFGSVDRVVLWIEVSYPPESESKTPVLRVLLYDERQPLVPPKPERDPPWWKFWAASEEEPEEASKPPESRALLAYADTAPVDRSAPAEVGCPPATPTS